MNTGIFKDPKFCFAHLTAAPLLAVFKEHSLEEKKSFTFPPSEGSPCGLASSKKYRKKTSLFHKFSALEKEEAAVEDSWM